jgi:hypothetical protein
MTYVPKFCRIAVVVDDLDAFTRDAAALLGLHFVSPKLDEQFTAFSVAFGEHGLMGIQPHEELPFASQGRLIEVAMDVTSADATTDRLVAGGYQPVVTNFLPAPAANEYLFGRDFHNIPLMVCTAGDNEMQMREQGPFAELELAPLPKVGAVTLMVENMADTARDLERFFDMTFVPCDPMGLGTAGLSGAHRVRLVEGHSPFRAEFHPPLASIDLIYEDVERQRAMLEKSGFSLSERALRSGGHAYYLGSSFHNVPITLYPASADQELRGI